ncbi:MAG TPA: hypothetical protein VGL72_00740, partial [Bryobacteraceae bacterium]
LGQVRDRVVFEHNRLPNYVCTETVERRYYSRGIRGKPTCEGLGADRNASQQLRLDKTDRLRLNVLVQDGIETLAWTGTAPAEHGVEDVLNSGSIGTGPAATHLLELFTNPALHFRLLSDPLGVLSYGFRMTEKDSQYRVWAAGRWVAVGYGGSIQVASDPSRLLRLDLQTDELPASSGMCQESTVLGFDEKQSSRFSWLVPVYSRTRNIDPDGTEIDRLTEISACRESSGNPPPAPAPRGQPLPVGLRLILSLDQEIDSDTAAAGDRIRATVAVDPDGITDPKYVGAKVTGRIVESTIDVQRQTFLVTLAFDTFEQNGEQRPFFAEIINPFTRKAAPSRQTRLKGNGVQDWPHGTLDFQSLRRNDHYLVPARSAAGWITVQSR